MGILHKRILVFRKRPDNPRQVIRSDRMGGVKMPAIAVRELDGSVRLVRDFDYQGFVSNLS